MSTFDLQSWLKDLELSDEERKVLEPVLAKDQVSKKIGESFLRQSDYSRKMNELGEERKKLEATLQQKLGEIDQYEQGLVSWKGNADKTLETREAEVRKLNEELKSTREAMSKIQQDYGIDPGQYVAAPSRAVPEKQIDEAVLGNFVRRDDFQKAVSDAMQFPQVAAELMDLNSEHYELFGKRLPSNRGLIESAIKNKKSIREVWADQYKVEDRRAELSKKSHDEEIERVRQETEARVRSELKIPAQRPNSSRPIVLSDSLKGREAHRGPQSDQNTLDAAMSAYASGKYAEQSQ